MDVASVSSGIGFGPIEIQAAALVEEGQQYVTTKIPESWTMKRNGVPRAGYSRLPADYHYIQWVKATVEQHISEKMPGASGQVVDLLV